MRLFGPLRKDQKNFRWGRKMYTFFSGLAWLVDKIFLIVYYLLVVRIILSWFGMNRYNELTQILLKITDPILMPFRRLPLQVGPIDFSPILAFFILWFLRMLIVGWLVRLATLFL